MKAAALYARKSTLTCDREEARPTTRQLEDGRAFCADRGWRVVEEHVEPVEVQDASLLVTVGHPFRMGWAGACEEHVSWRRTAALSTGTGDARSAPSGAARAG
jgi:hypothetical protein